MKPITLNTLLGDYPVTASLKCGAVSNDRIRFKYAEVAVPNTAFKRVVRDLEFDVAEIAIVTYLMARAQGVPLTLLPAVMTSRFQHSFLFYNSNHGTLTPADLNGKRIGIRSWTVTTVAWIRGMLSTDYGVDLDSIEWTTFEDAHVAGFNDPAGVKRATANQSLDQMLASGEIDAAIISAPKVDAAFRPVISNPDAEAIKWNRLHNAIQINHMVAVKSHLCEQEPQLVRDIYSLLQQSRTAADIDSDATPNMNPFGLQANQNNLQIALDFVSAQGLIPASMSVDDLFDDVTRELN